jgi:signal recognition particle subunit SRP54
LVKLVKDELTELMGGDVAGINSRYTFSNINVWFTRIRENYFLRKLANYLQTKKGKKNLYSSL